MKGKTCNPVAFIICVLSGFVLSLVGIVLTVVLSVIRIGGRNSGTNKRKSPASGVLRGFSFTGPQRVWVMLHGLRAEVLDDDIEGIAVGRIEPEKFHTPEEFNTFALHPHCFRLALSWAECSVKGVGKLTLDKEWNVFRCLVHPQLCAH